MSRSVVSDASDNERCDLTDWVCGVLVRYDYNVLHISPSGASSKFYFIQNMARCSFHENCNYFLKAVSKQILIALDGTRFHVLPTP